MTIPERSARRRNIQTSETADALGLRALTHLKDVLITPSRQKVVMRKGNITQDTTIYTYSSSKNWILNSQDGEEWYSISNKCVSIRTVPCYAMSQFFLYRHICTNWQLYCITRIFQSLK